LPVPNVLIMSSLVPRAAWQARRADGPDVFVHYSEIDGSGFRSLEEQQHVEFEVTPGPKGPQATRVRVA
jgi:cold shock CspA family protein